jgi:cbb3-type cytochrome oxidase subunit 3
MISEILLGLILIVLIFIAVMVYAIGEKLAENKE